MLFLVPGVQGYRYTEESGGTSAGRTGGISVHGHRSLQNNFLLDGVDNNSISTNVQELSTQLSRPSIDAIGEFKVVTTPFTAEYGRAPGATISVTTKSGNNTLRGTGYYYFRDERFDANTFFSNRSALPKPTNNQNQFGGSLGGPLRVGRAFFFADYEGTRITRGVLRTGTVPTADQRQRRLHVADPRSSYGTELRKQHDTGIADRPGSRGDSRHGAAAECDRAAATSSVSLTLPTITIASRDVSICGDRPTTTSLRDTATTSGSASSPAGSADCSTEARRPRGAATTSNSQSAVVGWTKILGPAVVNEFRYAWSQGRSDGYQDPKGEDGMSQIGFTGIPEENRTGGIIGVDVQGLIRMGSPNFMPKYQHTDQMQFIDTVSWLQRSASVQARRGNYGSDDEQLRRRASDAR